MANSSSHDWQIALHEPNAQAHIPQPTTYDPLQAWFYDHSFVYPLQPTQADYSVDAQNGPSVATYDLQTGPYAAMYGQQTKPVAPASLPSWMEVMGSLGSIQGTAEVPALPSTLRPLDLQPSPQAHINNTSRYGCEYPECFKTFSRKPDLIRHMKSVHAPAGWECDVCHKCFTREDILKRHKKMQHAKDV